MAGTIAAFPKHTFWDNNGAVAASHKLFTYLSGTSTKQTTYTDAALSSANVNPTILDASGRATIFLPPNTNWKFVLAPPTDSDPPIAPLWTVDAVQNVPTGTVNVDVDATAGETLAAGDVVYLSDGSGALTAGRWYKGDADNTYSSILAKAIGQATAAITAGSTGTVRVGGRVTGLAGLTAGTHYYVSATAGALTSTAPANAIIVGAADSTTSLVLTGGMPIKYFGAPPAGVPTYARCTATLTKNANITPADVTGMAFAVRANDVWAFEMHIAAVSPAAADYRFALTGPAVPTAIRYGIVGPNGIPSGVADTAAFGTDVFAGASGNDERLILSGLLRNGVNAGSVQLQMAQLTSTAGDTKVYVESFLTAWQITIGTGGIP